MGIFSRNQPTPDPRDAVGNNPTGRRQAANRLERDLQGTEHETKENGS